MVWNDCISNLPKEDGFYETKNKFGRIVVFVKCKYYARENVWVDVRDRKFYPYEWKELI